MAEIPFTPVPPAAEPVGFCQNCGRPLPPADLRRVGAAIFCEPCLIARLEGIPAPPASAGSAPYPGPGTTSGPNAAYGSVYGAGYVPAPVGGWPWQSPAGPATPPGSINPGTAALLGIIPGVGAMYNEQYAKGVAHLVIFAILVSLTNVAGIFGIIITGWMVYMVVEAHHTARARRDGTPLPNPFGLNDIGERMGFGRAWPQGTPASTVARDLTASFTAVANDAFRQTSPPVTAPPVPPPGSVPFAAGQQAWGAPADQFTEPPPFKSATAAGPMPSASALGQNPYTHVPYDRPPYQPFNPAAGGNVPPPYSLYPPYASSDPFFSTLPAAVPPPSRFPTGAAWLIGLGLFFLLGSTQLFNGLPGPSLLGFVVTGFGAWLFARNYASAANPAVSGIENLDERNLRILQLCVGLRSSLMFLLAGLLLLLHSFRILSWGQGWPGVAVSLGTIGIGTLMLLTRVINGIRIAALSTQPPAGWPPSPGPDSAYPAPGPAPQQAAPVHDARSPYGTPRAHASTTPEPRETIEAPVADEPSTPHNASTTDHEGEAHS